jgi:hypothetical protein
MPFRPFGLRTKPPKAIKKPDSAFAIAINCARRLIPGGVSILSRNGPNSPTFGWHERVVAYSADNTARRSFSAEMFDHECIQISRIANGKSERLLYGHAQVFGDSLKVLRELNICGRQYLRRPHGYAASPRCLVRRRGFGLSDRASCASDGVFYRDAFCVAAFKLGEAPLSFDGPSFIGLLIWREAG